jgi:hypothetical protein
MVVVTVTRYSAPRLVPPHLLLSAVDDHQVSLLALAVLAAVLPGPLSSIDSVTTALELNPSRRTLPGCK